MDYAAIVAALDARVLDAFKGYAEGAMKVLLEQLDERDQAIAAQAEQIKSLQATLDKQNEELALWLTDIRGESASAAQKQVREALAALPVPVYRGVFDRDAEYQAGAMVTHKGSVWHCNATVNGEAPGASEAWTLAVKCGRDGRDAKQPEAAE